MLICAADNYSKAKSGIRSRCVCVCVLIQTRHHVKSLSKDQGTLTTFTSNTCVHHILPPPLANVPYKAICLRFSREFFSMNSSRCSCSCVFLNLDISKHSTFIPIFVLINSTHPHGPSQMFTCKSFYTVFFASSQQNIQS